MVNSVIFKNVVGSKIANCDNIFLFKLTLDFFKLFIKVLYLIFNDEAAALILVIQSFRNCLFFFLYVLDKNKLKL